MPDQEPDDSWRGRVMEEPEAEDDHAWKSRIQEEPEEDAGAINAAMRGAAKGATFGFADKGAAGLMALRDVVEAELGMRGDIDIGDAYSTNLGAIQARDKEVSEHNPWTSGVSEVAGGVLTPLNKLFGGAKTLGPAGGALEGGIRRVMMGNAASGALSGAGNSSHTPWESPDELKAFAMDAVKGGALGGGLGGLFHAGGQAISALAPERMRKAAAEWLGSVSGSGSSKKTAELLGQADDAGAPVVGWFSRAKGVAANADKKAQFFGKRADRIAGEVDAGKLQGADADDAIKMFMKMDARKQAYERIAEKARSRAADKSTTWKDLLPGGMAAATSLMHGGGGLKTMALTAAVTGGAKMARERAPAFLGRGLNAAADVAEKIPQGRAMQMANDALLDGPAAAGVTNAVLSGDPVSRRQRLIERLQHHQDALRSQGYDRNIVPEPSYQP